MSVDTAPRLRLELLPISIVKQKAQRSLYILNTTKKPGDLKLGHPVVLVGHSVVLVPPYPHGQGELAGAGSQTVRAIPVVRESGGLERALHHHMKDSLSPDLVSLYK